MLDIRHIENNKKQVIEQLTKRGLVDASQQVEKLLAINEKRKKTQVVVDTLANELKKKACKVAELLKRGEKTLAEDLKKDIVASKKTYKKHRGELKILENTFQTQLLDLPNLPHKQVPIGRHATDNEIVKEWRPTPTLYPSFKLQPHWELINKYDLINFEQGNKITGAGFPVYKGKGAKLQRALINFFLDQATQNGYQEVQPPLIVNKASALGTGQLPDKEGAMYPLQEEGMYLIPTAEVPITNLYRNTLLTEKDFPIKQVAYTPCFRREAGSWGRHVRGLNRLHQFDKVELVEILLPETSELALQNMCLYIRKLLEKLGLQYRVLKLCTGELGFAASITYDIEVWSSGQGQWLEVSSITLFGTYQARRMQLRYKKEGKNKFCHTLNGSALALPRILAALFENFQTPTSIKIPPVLYPYTSFEKIDKS